VLDCVADWQEVYLRVLGHRLVHASDEYYLLAQRPFPAAETYEGFAMHEDGVGMATTFELEFYGRTAEVTSPREGFFAWADASQPPTTNPGSRYEAAADLGAPPNGYRAERSGGTTTAVALRARPGAPVAVLTGEAGAAVLAPLLGSLERPRPDVRILPVENRFFGGTTSVTGLLTGEDLARVLDTQPEGHRYLLADVCLSGGRFHDGITPADLPRPVEIIATDGAALRRALEA
jgi:hypothetical protein